MSPLQKLKTQFLEYLEIEKNRSKLTTRNYDLYISRFINFAKNRGASAAEKLDLDLVRNFRLWLNRQRDRSNWSGFAFNNAPNSGRLKSKIR